ncbi:MAG: transposase [Isosphaeraceae bacterium]
MSARGLRAGADRLHPRPGARHPSRCPACGSADVVSRHVERRFRCLPIGSRPTFLAVPVPRVGCCPAGWCGRWTSPSPTRGGATPRRFERYVLELSRRMTIRDVAAHLGVGWDLVKDVQKRDLSRPLRQAELAAWWRIAIDEIAVARGHRHMTIVLDLDSGAVVFVGDGKADALKPFWKRLRPSGAKVEAVAMDMSAAYRGAVSAHLKKAVIVFDHFHVVKLFNDRLSDLRRSLLYHRVEADQKKVLKGRGGCC